MARTTDQLLDQVERFVPPEDRPTLRPLLAGHSAAQAVVEAARNNMLSAVTLAGADGRWLTLLARGYGIRRATDETDEVLRTRLRYPERQLTPGAIIDRVNDLLSPYTSTLAVLEEWWEVPSYIEDGWYLDHFGLSGGPHWFVVRCPVIGEIPHGTAYIGIDLYLDHSFLGADEHPVYERIAAEVDRIRAAGVRAALFIDSSL